MKPRAAVATILNLMALAAAPATGSQRPAAASAQNAVATRPDSAALRWVTEFLAREAKEGAFPSAVLIVGWQGKIGFRSAVGHYGVDDPRPVTDSTIYDLASLTKVVGLTTATMFLVADGRLALDAPVVNYVPAFSGPEKAAVLVRHLLTHTSGLAPWAALHLETTSPQEALEWVNASALHAHPGTRYAYSDLGAIVLTEAVEAAADEPLDRFLQHRLLEPLGMAHTRFLPPVEWRDRIAPTERDPWRGRVLRGEVHDENAARLGGISGHAGLFSSGPDLARFAIWLLDAYHGRLSRDMTPFLPPQIVRDFTRTQPGPAESTRALGWDTPSATGGGSAGHLLSPSSFGHTGFTGTSLWIDPEREFFIILLTNRVHPTRTNNRIRRIRGVVADSVAAALTRQ